MIQVKVISLKSEPATKSKAAPTIEETINKTLLELQQQDCKNIQLHIAYDACIITYFKFSDNAER